MIPLRCTVVSHAVACILNTKPSGIDFAGTSSDMMHTPGKIVQHITPVHTVITGQGCHTKMHKCTSVSEQMCAEVSLEIRTSIHLSVLAGSPG